ncbi:MAG: response regulator [Pyrinomonadaceae bacterium]|nr:response regulator [Pyrinomonadaceae bacterium]
MTRILVVDDEPSIRSLIRSTLEPEGFDVAEAENGLEAIESLLQTPAEVVFMDIIMPEKEGIETIMEIRKSFPKTKIIAISGVGSDSPYLLMARQLGAHSSLDKPFSPVEIIEKVNEMLSE